MDLYGSKLGRQNAWVVLFRINIAKEPFLHSTLTYPTYVVHTIPNPLPVTMVRNETPVGVHIMRKITPPKCQRSRSYIAQLGRQV
ncbi:hypothetical protein PAXRUDRAFT_550973 [Paxillus rubicundulus Ve08.2h10]|uniref:Uncharacterized protein n=1 Tax=Paxillus rubicundulus Ve08.2h10 TaxID=930991 RepID=A0A0D0DMH9_9AGAM|nr:hypothetical protein PAXRUDRAFT_550973 [Paxillus rubicundulus Ve08.2h10]